MLLLGKHAGLTWEVTCQGHLFEAVFGGSGVVEKITVTPLCLVTVTHLYLALLVRANGVMLWK